MRILVVDDDMQTRRALGRLLRTCGFDVAEAPDGVEALAQLAGRPADLIVTDLTMPRLDGVGLTDQVRREGDRTPILMLSAEDDPGLLDSAARTGVNAFIGKPVDTELLIETVRNLLGSDSRNAMGEQQKGIFDGCRTERAGHAEKGLGSTCNFGHPGLLFRTSTTLRV